MDAVFGCHGVTALQPWGEIVPLGCRAVVSRQPHCRITAAAILFPPNRFVFGFIQYLCGKIEYQCRTICHNGNRHAQHGTITFCTKNREVYFGDVVDGRMELSEIGEWTQTQIKQTASIRQNVYNHVAPCRDTSNVSASNVSENNGPNNVSSDARGLADARGASLQFGPQSGNLPSVIRGIKSAVTKYAIEHEIPFAWQSRYHDHIIRNQLEMNRIADYIQNNPMKWELDRFYKKRE